MIRARTLLVLEVLTTIVIQCTADTANGDHICRREESYTELVRMPVQQTVRVRSSNWCLDIPPRCSNYKTEIREVIKVQNVTKTRTIEFCCEGYARITTGNDTVCRPICRGGCGRGYCQAPNQCSCDVGYTGSHCTQRCGHDQWGEDCSKVCRCRNDSVCDNQTGQCLCADGWMGDMCEEPCPPGFYGAQCRALCECSTNRCNPQTGACMSDVPLLISKHITSLHPVLTTLKNSNERINATEWIRVGTDSTSQTEVLENEKYQVYDPTINTSSVIETLNSTIANLTENIDKLTKNLDKQAESVTILVSEPVLEVTTVGAIQEVILIKPENPRPAIFVHQPTVVTGVEQTEILSNSPEVIHFITNWQTQTKEVLQNETKQESPPAVHESHDLGAVISVLAIFSLVVLGAAVAFVVLYRKYLIRHREQNPAADFDTIQRAKTFTKPLPDLPAFTQNLTKTEIPEFYDRPMNNQAVRPTTSPYSYTTASLYSVVSKNYPRKHSLEHLYDEIKYPPISNSNV